MQRGERCPANKEQYSEVLSVLLVFHMDSSGLKPIFGNTVGIFQKKKYIEHLHRTLNMIKLH